MSQSKAILNNYKNFSSMNHRVAKPKITFYSVKDKKELTEDMSLESVGKISDLYNDFSKYYYFLGEIFGLHGVDNKGFFPKVYIGREDRQGTYCVSRQGHCALIPSEHKDPGILFHNDALRKGIIAHELSHGIIHYFSKLHGQEFQQRVLNESFADIISISFRHWLKKGSNTILHWIGYHCSRKDRPDLGEREWKQKTRDLSQQKNLDQYCEFYGPHDNSLISGHAFYFACAKCLNCPSYQLAKIWLDAAIKVPKENANIKGFRKQTIIEASRFLWQDEGGKLHEVNEAVSKGWNQVGVNEESKMPSTIFF